MRYNIASHLHTVLLILTKYWFLRLSKFFVFVQEMLPKLKILMYLRRDMMFRRRRRLICIQVCLQEAALLQPYCPPMT